MPEGRDTRNAEQGPGKRPPWWKRLWEWMGFDEKKLWDWLQLLSTLAIPVVLTVAGFWFADQQDQREAQRAELERELEEQRANDTALQQYLDQMSHLLLEKDLRDSEAGSETRTLARARTLAVLATLDPDRKKTLLQFLYEADLMNRPQPVISLAGANLQAIDLPYFDLSHGETPPSEIQAVDDICLTVGPDSRLYGDCGSLPPRGWSWTTAAYGVSELRGTNLSGADLRHANLSWTLLVKANLNSASLEHANLRHAVLIDADLNQADLRNADLSDADLTGADLGEADLTGATGITDEEIEKRACSIQDAAMPGGWTMTWDERTTCEQKRAAGKDGENTGPS
jgi:uncharacterized protein YjbI with pentapeptide repeats